MISSFVKPANAVMTGYHFLRSIATGRPEVAVMPLSVSVELTNHCNLQCPECHSGAGILKRERGFMELDLFRSFYPELKPYIYNLSLYFQGEPMLHPQFFSFLPDRPAPFTTVSTNGHFLTAESAGKLVRSGLNKLIISLDGMEQEVYSSYRVNGDLELVMEGIRSIADAKKRTNSALKTEIQFLVNRKNEHQILKARQFAKEVNASFRLKSMQIVFKDDMEEWVPSLPAYSRYRRKNGEFRIKSRLPSRCLRLWLNPVITWDGKVVPCCFDKDARYVMGDLNKQSFREIWGGKLFSEFRGMVLKNRRDIDICRNCTSGLIGVKN